MKQIKDSGVGRLLADLLTAATKQPGAPKPIPGSKERYIHHSMGGRTYRANTKRSRDRAARRSGLVSARQQRIHRTEASRVMRDWQQDMKAAA